MPAIPVCLHPMTGRDVGLRQVHFMPHSQAVNFFADVCYFEDSLDMGRKVVKLETILPQANVTFDLLFRV